MSNKEKNFISAVIYIHNAEQRIAEFLKMIIEILEDNFEYSEIICVNDNSEDDSLKVIDSVSQIAESTNISVLNMSYFHGLEMAMNAGVDLSIGDFVFEFDNTFPDFNRETVMDVYRHIFQGGGYDIVSAMPDRREKLTSKVFYLLFDRFTNLSYQIHTESFRILSRRVINRISSMNKSVPYRKAIYASQGLKTDTITYHAKKIIQIKQDKQEEKYRFGLAIDSLILFTELGYRFSMAMAALMMFISAFMIIYSIVIFSTAHPVAGWTTTILFLSVAFFGLFAVLTIVIKYLQLIVNLVFKRKQYSFEGIRKLTK